MSAKPWADPGKDAGWRAQELADHFGLPNGGDISALTEAIRAAEADAYARGKAETAPTRSFEPDPAPDRDAARFRALAEQGKTGKQIARELGVSYPRVVRLLHKAGFYKDKAVWREAAIREAAVCVARGEAIAAAAARLGVKQGWLGAQVADRFRHDHPFNRRQAGAADDACLWCGHRYEYDYAPGGYSPYDRCHERVKAIARGDEAALLSERQRMARDRDAPAP